MEQAEDLVGYVDEDAKKLESQKKQQLLSQKKDQEEQEEMFDDAITQIGSSGKKRVTVGQLEQQAEDK